MKRSFIKTGVGNFSAMYFENLRRVRTLGIILTAVLTFESLLTALVYSLVTDIAPLSRLSTILVNAILLGVVLSMVLYGYGNHRNKSDFYFAIPQSRDGLYLANGLAALTWTMLSIITELLCVSIVYAAFGVTLNPASLLLVLLGCLLVGLLTITAMGVGCAVTGRGFSALVTGLLLLLLPRILFTSMELTVKMLAPTVAKLQFPFFLDGYQMAFGAFTSLLSGGASLLKNGWHYLYSLVLAALQLWLGLILYRRRPAEACGDGFVSVRARNIVSGLTACTVLAPVGCLIPALLLAKDERTGLVVLLIVFVIIALLIYGLVQLTARSRWRGLVRGLGYFGLSAALSILVMLLGWGVGTIEQRREVQQEDIRSIELVREDQNSVLEPVLAIMLGYYNDGYPYRTLCSPYVDVTNDATCRIAAQTLRDDRYLYDSAARKGQSGTDYLDTLLFSNTTTNNSSSLNLRITLKSGAVLTRELQMYSDDYDVFTEAAKGSEGYIAYQKAMPTDKEIRSCSFTDLAVGEDFDQAAFLSTYRSEYTGAEGSMDALAFTLRGCSHADSYRQTYYVTLYDTPKSARLLMDAVNEAGAKALQTCGNYSMWSTYAAVHLYDYDRRLVLTLHEDSALDTTLTVAPFEAYGVYGYDSAYDEYAVAVDGKDTGEQALLARKSDVVKLLKTLPLATAETENILSLRWTAYTDVATYTRQDYCVWLAPTREQMNALYALFGCDPDA